MNVELIIYDENLNRIGLIEEFSSLLWTRKYYEPGNFQLVLPMTPRNVSYIQEGRILRKIGSKEAGVVEYIKMDDKPKSKTMTVKGRFLSSYMDRRLLKGTLKFSGKSEIAMRTCLTTADPIPLVELGDLMGYEDKIVMQVTYKDLLETMKKLSKQSGHGFRFTPDFVNKKIYFDIYDGLDRSMNQFDRNRVVFSDEYLNLNDVSYTTTSTLYKNVFYIAGEGEGEDRKIITIGDTDASGLNRREVFIDARDLQKGDLTDEEYEELLISRGLEKQSSYFRSESFDSTVNPMVNFKYMTDYDLGDIVTISKSAWGKTKNLRITEIMEQHTKGSMQIVPTFGDPIPELNWSEMNE